MTRYWPMTNPIEHERDDVRDLLLFGVTFADGDCARVWDVTSADAMAQAVAVHQKRVRMVEELRGEDDPWPDAPDAQQGLEAED